MCRRSIVTAINLYKPKRVLSLLALLNALKLELFKERDLRDTQKGEKSIILDIEFFLFYS